MLIHDVIDHLHFCVMHIKGCEIHHAECSAHSMMTSYPWQNVRDSDFMLRYFPASSALRILPDIFLKPCSV